MADSRVNGWSSRKQRCQKYIASRPPRRSDRLGLELLESRLLLCATHFDPIAYPVPEWSDAIEQSVQAARGTEGGPDAVSIVWTNKGVYTGPNDSRFDDVFGTSASAAEGVVQAALDAWSRVITSFNRADGTSTLQVSVTMGTNIGFGGAGAPASTAPADGKPRTGSITINTGNNSADPNDSNGYFLDTTPHDYSEFAGPILTPFAGNPSSALGSDLFSLVVSEVTHTLGLISPGPAGGFNGYRLIDSGFTHNTGNPGIRDNAEGGGTAGYFYTFNGPSVTHLMTSYNSANATSTSWGNVIHTAGGTANISYNGINYFGMEDDGNAAYGNERVLPSWVTAHILSDAYGYSIEDPARFGTMYSVLDSTTGLLTVRGLNDSDDMISITRSGSTLTVSVDVQQDVPGSHSQPGVFNAPAWTTVYNLAQVASINVLAGTGDDTVMVSADMGGLPVTVNDALGNDKLQIIGTAAYDAFATLDNSTIDTTNGQVTYFSMETLEIFTGDGDADVNLQRTGATAARVTGGPSAQTINFSYLDLGTPTIIDLGNGNDVLNFATGDGVTPIRSPVTIFGGVGDDTINIAPSDFASTVITQPVTVFGDTGNDTLALGSNNADSIDVNITFDGGVHAGPIGDRIVINDTAVSYNVSYDIASTSVTRDGANPPRTVSYSNTESIIIKAGSGADMVTLQNGLTAIVTANGNAGNDNFIVGGGNMNGYFPQILNGGTGTDKITFNDQLNPAGKTWDVNQDFHPNEIIYGGLITLGTAGFEAVGILAGLGNDQINFYNDITQHYEVNSGSGADSDIVRWYAANNWFRNPMGGDITEYTVTLNGGTSGFDLLLIEDAGRSETAYNITSGTLFGLDDDFMIRGERLNYTGFGAVTVLASNQNNRFELSGANPATSYLLDGRNGDDLFALTIDPTAAAALGFNVDCRGGAGSDTFSMNDSTFATDTDYVVNSSGVTRTSGSATRLYSLSGVETMQVTGTSANDTFSVNNFSSGAALRINGHDGDDAFHWTPLAKDLTGRITNMSSFSYDGGAGYDSYYLHNDNSTGSWEYRRTTNQLTVLRFNVLNYVFNDFNTEYINLTGGTVPDAFTVRSTASGSTLDLDGLGDNDFYELGNFGITDGILGSVHVSGSQGIDSVTVDDSANTTGKTVHVDNYFVGGVAGDTLLGPGGNLYFVSIIGPLTVRLGSGSDTVYVVPHPFTPVIIEGNDQAAAETGDSIGFAFAAAVNPIFTAGPMGEGQYTFDNRAPIHFYGIEQTQIDDVGPQLLSSTYADLPIPSLTFKFDEDVSTGLSIYSLELINSTTMELVPYASLDVTYNASTNEARFTFPGYPLGRLPTGDYSARVYESTTDLFGNPLGVVSPLLFHVDNNSRAGDFDGDFDLDGDDIDALVMAIAGGGSPSIFDLTGDGLLNLADRDIWLALAGAANLPSGSPYLLGDANLDGIVDGQDFIRWNSRKFTSTGKWTLADWNADGVTDGQDFIVWNTHKFTAVAAPLAYESFDYADGSLFGQTGGTGWSNIWTGNGVDVVSGKAVGNLFSNPPKYGSRNFNNPQTTTNLFVRLDLTTITFGINDYFGAYTGAGVNNSQVQFGKFPGSNEFQVGNGGFSSSNINIAPNTTYRLIGAYAVVPGPAPDLLMLWVNPTPTDYFDPTTLAHSADVFRTELVSPSAQFINIFTGIPGISFDNLAISDNPAGVGLRNTAPVIHRIPQVAINDLNSIANTPVASGDDRSLHVQSNAFRHDMWMHPADERLAEVWRAGGGAGTKAVVAETDCSVCNGRQLDAVSTTPVSILVDAAGVVRPDSKLPLRPSQGFDGIGERSCRCIDAAFATDEL